MYGVSDCMNVNHSKFEDLKGIYWNPLKYEVKKEDKLGETPWAYFSKKSS